MGRLIAANDNNGFCFYIYAWQYPDGRTFYIGKGFSCRDTVETNRNAFFRRIVAKIRRDGGEPRVVRWHEGLCEKDALDLEIAYIKLYGRRDIRTGVLSNLTDGGEGQSGLVHTEETRRKISAAHSSPEARQLMRERATGNKYCVGREMSADARAKIGNANRGREVSEETRAKLAAANLLRGPELASKLRWMAQNQTQETRDKTGAAHKGKLVSAETRARMSLHQRMAPPRTGYKGVCFDKERSLWLASIGANGKKRKLGFFSDQARAAMAYDRAAIDAWGIGGCYTNFPARANDNGQLSLQFAS